MDRYDPQITNCDWLAFSMRMILTDAERLGGVQLATPDGYILAMQSSGTNQFKNRAIVYTEHGDKVLTLLWQPHSKIIASNTLFVEVANRLLYSNFNPLPLLDKIHATTFGTLSRFDVCTDFQPTDYQSAIIDMLTRGDAYVQGKREGSLFHDFKQGDKVERHARQLAWGNPQTNIRWKLYNKTKEITQIDDKGRTWCSKPYIRDMWYINGLDPKKDTWRLECSINSASTHQWRGEKLDINIYNPEVFTPLFYDLLATRFVIRKNEGHQYKKYDTRLPFLREPVNDHYRLRRLDPKGEQQHTDHATTLRNLMKELDRPETQCNETICATLLAATERVIRAANLQGYFLRSTGKSWETWRQNFVENLVN